MTPELVTAIGGVVAGLAGAAGSFLIAVRRLEATRLRAENKRLRRRVRRLERALDATQEREAQ